MTNAELLAKIKAEIERQMKFYDEKEMKAWDGSERGDEDALWYQGHRKMCAKLLSFLSTLDPEKPVPADLEEAKEAYCEEHNDDCFDATGDKCPHIRNAFIAGAKWQADHTPLPEDTVLFNKGVEEGKRLMMEEAVKWLVDDDYDELTDKGGFILGSVGIGYNGYYIPYGDLLKLPKED